MVGEELREIIMLFLGNQTVAYNENQMHWSSNWTGSERQNQERKKNAQSSHFVSTTCHKS